VIIILQLSGETKRKEREEVMGILSFSFFLPLFSISIEITLSGMRMEGLES
jgi:hypothetical protein